MKTPSDAPVVNIGKIIFQVIPETKMKPTKMDNNQRHVLKSFCFIIKKMGMAVVIPNLINNQKSNLTVFTRCFSWCWAATRLRAKIKKVFTNSEGWMEPSGVINQ